MSSPDVDNSANSLQSQKEMELDFKIVEENELCGSVTQVEYDAEDVYALERSSSSQVEFDPNVADEKIRFGSTHIDIDGKRLGKRDIRNLLVCKEELRKNLYHTRRCCFLLRKQLEDERRKNRIRREDFRHMQTLLQRYAADQEKS